MQDQILVASRMPWPADWPAVFGRPGPLYIEIGFGNGAFLLDLARRNLDANVLGLEISLPSLMKGEKKAARARQGNICVIQATARTALWALCAPDSVGRIYANFPDPWPKAAHHGRRLVNSRFLALAASRMIRGGRLSIATDHPGYAAWIADCLKRTPYFASDSERPFTNQDKSRFRTKYELKALARGETPYYFNWERNDVPVADSFPIPPELPMPHAVVSLPLEMADVTRHFASHQPSPQVANGSTTVRYIDLYHSFSHETIVIDTYIGEEPLEQRLLLAVTYRPAGDFLIHVHDVGFPRPTPGVHQAIRALAEWLAGIHPAGRISHHNLSP